MRKRDTITFWAITLGLFLLLIIIGLVIGRIPFGGFILLSVLLIAVGSYVSFRIFFTSRFTSDLQPRRPPPPERELIDHAKRPTLYIGLAILGITLLAITVISFVSIIGADPAPEPGATPAAPTPGPSSETAASGDRPTWFTAPVVAAGVGVVVLVIVALGANRSSRPNLTLVKPRPEPAPHDDDTDPALDWREMLGEGEDDLSVWVDGLSGDDEPRT